MAWTIRVFTFILSPFLLHTRTIVRRFHAASKSRGLISMLCLVARALMLYVLRSLIACGLKNPLAAFPRRRSPRPSRSVFASQPYKHPALHFRHGITAPPFIWRAPLFILRRPRKCHGVPLRRCTAIIPSLPVLLHLIAIC